MAQKKIPHLGAEQGGRRFGAGMVVFSCAGCYNFSFRAGLAANIRAGGYNFPFRAEKDTSFRRRIGRLSVPRVKRYPIPAQNREAGVSGRELRRNPAQNPPAKHSGRKMRLISAQNPSVKHSGRKMRRNPAQNREAGDSARKMRQNPARNPPAKYPARNPVRKATSAPGKQHCLCKQQIPQISDTIQRV